MAGYYGFRSKRQPKSGKKSTYFIADAIKKEGSLRDYIQSTYGSGGFDSEGRIKSSILNKLAKGKCPTCGGTPKTCVCPTRITQRRAVLARTLRKIGKARYSE